MYQVILADDNLDTIKGIRQVIHWDEMGFAVAGLAKNGQEVLDMMKKNPVDLVITDINMPIMDGLTLSKHLREQYPATRIVVLTGYSEFDYAKQAIRLGVKEYLMKPVKVSEINELMLRIKNELDMEQSRREQEMLAYRRMVKSMPIVKSDYLKNIISDPQFDTNLAESFSFLNIHLEPTQFILLLLNIDQLNDLKKSHSIQDLELLRFCISNIAGELAVTYNQKVDLFNYNSGSIVVLFNYRPDLSDQKNREELSALAEQICEQVETLLETPITIGVSNPHEGAEGINLCFREAQSAVNYKLYVPTSKVIFISDMETKQAQGTFRYPTEAENELITVVKSGAQDYLPSTLDSYLGSLQESTSGPILFKNIIVEFLSRLSRMLYDSNCIPQEQLHFIRSAVEELELCRSLSEIRSWLMQILSGFTEEIGRNRKTDMTQEMERAKQYILEHYNEHIMLTDVAAIVHLSPTYFSSCFKEVVGETFMEYLTKTRIQKARELLSTGQYKVYEVASMVGYRDRRYFSEIFKKYTGKNPADYIT